MDVTGSPAGFDSAMRFQTHNADECKEYFRAQQGTHQFDLSRGPSFQDFQHHEWPVGRLSLNLIEMRCAGDFTVTKAQPASYYQFNFLLEGSCRVKGRFGNAIAQPGDAFIIDPDQPLTELWEDRMMQYLLRVDRRLIDGMLSTELGKSLKQHVVFDPVAHDPGIGPWLRHIAANTAEAGNLLLSDRRVVKSIEDTLITMLLTGFRHSELAGLERSAQGVAPYYVKRAEEHIHANARNDLTIENIAAVAKVSPRTLFYGFKRWRGKSPMAYVRDARLDIARKELEMGRESGGSVSGAAINAGFTNFSQFSRIYKARFGEPPSATLLGH